MRTLILITMLAIPAFSQVPQAAPQAGVVPGVNTLQGVPVTGTNNATTLAPGNSTLPPGNSTLAQSNSTLPPGNSTLQPTNGIAAANPAAIPYTAASGTSQYITGLTPDLSTQNLASSSVIDANAVMDTTSVQSYISALNANPSALANAQGLTSQLRGANRLGSDEQVIGYSMGRVITAKSSLISQSIAR